MKLKSLKELIIDELKDHIEGLSEISDITSGEHILDFIEKNMKDEMDVFNPRFEYDIYVKNSREHGKFRTGTARMSEGDNGETPFRAEIYRGDYSYEQLISDDYYDINSSDKMEIYDAGSMDAAIYDCIGYLSEDSDIARVILDKYNGLTRVEAIHKLMNSDDTYCIIKIDDETTDRTPTILWFDISSANFISSIACGRMRNKRIEGSKLVADVYLGAVNSLLKEKNDNNNWVKLQEGSYVAIYPSKIVVVKGPKYKKTVKGMENFIKLLAENKGLLYQVEEPNCFKK